MKTQLETMVREAGTLFLEGYRARKEITFKSAVDLVTQYDVQIENFLKPRLAEAFPGYTVIGEESSRTLHYPEKAIYIDPIDGTTNFVHGIPFCAISVGVWEHGRPAAGVVYNPVLGECFAAEAGKGATLNGEPLRVGRAETLTDALLATGFPYTKIERGEDFEWVMRTMRSLLPESRDIRRLGSAAIDLCYVARGTFDGFYEINLKPWDVAAGILMVQEAGGTISREDGGHYALGEHIIVASNGTVHKALVEAIASGGPR